MTTPRTLVARILPDSANRSLWWLVAITMAALALPGPFWGSAISIQVTKKDYWHEVLLGLVGNSIGVVVAVVVLALLLRRRSPDRSSAIRDVGYVVLASLVGTSTRLAMVWLLQVGPQPMGRWALITQVSVAVPLLGATSVAIVYAASRERLVAAGFRETAAAQAALAREEEDVRGRVFDQLHGTLQAGLVDARRQLLLLADSAESAQPGALRALERQLAELYSAEVDGLTRSLYPAGLEIGLNPALGQLAARYSGTIDIRLDVDSFTLVLDDPALGGLSRDLRFGAYRIVEECVLNAMRHSPADAIDVEIHSELTDTGARLLITARNRVDDLSPVVSGHGLNRMRQRANGLGGTLSVDVDGGEFSVCATLPLQRD